jgi:hypothetical protein
MAFANLGELKTVISDTLNRDDLTAQIPNFIKMNEESVNRKVNVSEMEEYTEFTINVGQTTLPTNFLEMRNIQMKNSEYPLQYVPHNSLDGIGADSGIPKFYSIQGTKLLFYPFPPDSTIGIMRYLAEVTPLVNDVDTNWLLNKSPQIYLYGTLLHAAPFLNDDSRLPVWGALFEDAIKALNDQDKRRMSGTKPQMINATAGYY